jgi:tetratricopeptide (TPR) repeat protein
MPDNSGTPLIFISYASKDEKWLAYVKDFLGPMQISCSASLFIDSDIGTGDEWKTAIDRNLRDCDLFVLLLSRHSLNSPFIVETEIKSVQDRLANDENSVKFFPIYLTHTHIDNDFVANVQHRPRTQPLSGFKGAERDAEMQRVAEEIRGIVTEIAARKTGTPSIRPSAAQAECGGRRHITNIDNDIVPLNFIGRDDALRGIADGLKRGPVVLLGIPGVGKTSVALRYAITHQSNYAVTWRVDAGTPDTLRRDLLLLGHSCGWVKESEKQEELASEAVLDQLKIDGDARILLIYDGVGGFDVQHLVKSKAHLIFTSKAVVLGRNATLIEIHGWSKTHGADFLITRAGRGEPEREDAEELSDALGGVPLALETTAAFCQQSVISFADCCQRFKQTPHEQLRRRDPVYHDSVVNAFDLAIGEVASKHPAVKPLLGHAALLAPARIPIFLFSEAREKFGPRFASELAGDGLKKAIDALAEYRLVEREQIDAGRRGERREIIDVIRLNNLVRTIAGYRSGEAAHDDAHRALIEAMAEVFPKKPYGDALDRASLLDALALALVGESAALPKGAENAASELMTRLGLYRRADLALAQKLFSRALDIRRELLGSGHPLTIESLTELAFVYKDSGSGNIAQNLLEEARDNCVMTFGDKDLRTAESVTKLAHLLKDQNQLVKACELYEKALEIRKNVPESDQLDIAQSITDLAFVVKDQGELKRARELFIQALDIRMKRLGAEDNEIATSRNNLGFVLKDQGDLAWARDQFEKAHEICMKNIRGKEGYAEAATSFEVLAFLHKDLREYAAAKPLYERAYKYRADYYGANHPKTLDTQNKLSYVIQAMTNGAGPDALTSPEAPEAWESWRRRMATAAKDLWETFLQAPFGRFPRPRPSAASLPRRERGSA